MKLFTPLPLAFLLFATGLGTVRAGESLDFSVAEEAVPLFDFADDASARKAWKPMRGTAAVSRGNDEGGKGVTLRCNFRGTDIDRASWDRSIRLDLARAAAVRFRIRCPDPSSISHCTFYFASGEGWYAAPFSADGSAGWKTVVLRKGETKIEGKPAGWGNVKTLRFSAWRGGDRDAVIHAADFTVLRVRSPVAVLLGESSATGRGDGWEEVRRYSTDMTRRLEKAGLRPLLLSDLDLDPKSLAAVRLLVLPHNPSLPDSAVQKILQFVERGGKLLVFFTLHPALAKAVGIAPARFVRQERPGFFARLLVDTEVLPGAPPIVAQRSWNIRNARALSSKSGVAARWADDRGVPTGHNAVLVSPSCVHMTHVLLPGDAGNKARLLLAMAGRLLPEAWERAAKVKITDVGVFGPFPSTVMALEALEASEGARPRALLKEARKGLQECMALLKDESYPEAIALSHEVRERLVTAYCASREPLDGEHRAFWCHSAFGVEGMSWDVAVEALASNGFTVVQPNMLWGGVAFYESDVLPVAHDVRTRGDQVRLCVAACKKHGVECHVWKVNWNMGWRAPRPFADRMKREGRIQVRFNGKAEPRWLCPSHPANQALEIDAMVEVARKYEVHGVHFDYIRYPGPHCCFCAGCRARFEETFDLRVARWPRDVREDAGLNAKWLAFRRGSITRVVEGVSERARKVRPGIRISAAVFRNWPSDRNTIGQDWKAWCDKGYLDYVCPMDYTEDDAAFEAAVSRQKKWAGRVPCYPGIGLSCWADPSDVCKLIAQIEATRRLKTGGFTVFELGERETKEILPLCGEGITRKKK
ncbi:MAG: glycoside hydrolase family 10 protein [Planctomycetota bacterium]|jgi:uncharacterized lipoprotein YddW (UPF0748 family)